MPLLNSIINSLNDAIWAASVDMKDIFFVIPAFEELTGYSKEELIAILTFNVFNEKGDALWNKFLKYKGEQFNEFWNGFNTGTFLYEELKKNANLDITILDSESEFINN